MAKKAAYTYNAKITRVVDGDTFEATVDLGFSTHVAGITLRLDGVDAFETKKTRRAKSQAEKTGRGLDAIIHDGKTATATLAKIFDEHPEVIITTRKDDQTDVFGRYLAKITCKSGDLGAWLIKRGLALKV
jgi:endonuclease YncB( thermonuclease family)